MDQEKPLKVIQVQQLPKKPRSKNEVLKLLSVFCLYYPAYTLAAARRLPYKHVSIMLDAARREEARKNFNLVQIAAAPHTKKGSGVTKLSNQFKDQMNE